MPIKHAQYFCFISYQNKAKQVITHNIEALRNLGVKEVVFTCAGCQKTFEKDYKQFGGKFKSKTYLEFIKNLIDEGKIKFTETNPIKVTYHDPCHSTKRDVSTRIFEIPRKILQQMPGIELVEMKSHKQGSMCCGAGGGVKRGGRDRAG